MQIRTEVRFIVLVSAFLCSCGIVPAVDLTWRLGTGGNWDAATGNWTNSAGTITTFADTGADNVTFNNANGGTINITANMTPMTSTVSSTSGSYSFTNGPIDGGVLVKSGGSILKLESANTYAGGTILSGGTLELRHKDALGTGPVSVTAASAFRGSYNGGPGPSINITNSFNLSAFLAVGGGGYPYLTNSGPWTLLSNSRLALGGQGSGGGQGFVTFTGSIGGSGNLTLVGAQAQYGYAAARMEFRGNNTYTGTTTVSLFTNGISNPLQYQYNGIFIYGDNTPTGPWFINSAEVNISNNRALGTNTVTVSRTVAGWNPVIRGVPTGSPYNGAASVTISNPIQLDARITVAGGGYGTVTFAGPWNLLSDSTIDNSQGSGTAVISGNIGGNYSLTLASYGTAGSDTGTLTLSGSNTWSGSTYLGTSEFGANNAARIKLAGGFAIPDTSTVNLTNRNGIVLDLNGTTERIGALEGGGSLGGTVTLGSGTLITGGNTSNTTFGGIISGTGGKLIKEGTSVFALMGANTYTGGTTVSNGILRVNNGTGSGTGTGAVRVTPGGTLGGTGTVSGAVTVDGGAALAPGNSPGILHLAGGLSLASNATLSIEINGPTVGTQYDQVDVTGAVGLTNSLLQLVMGFSPTPGQQFIIVSNDAADAIGGTFAGRPQGSFIDASTTGIDAYFNISYLGSTKNDIVLTATIPEPATLGLLAMGGLLLLRRQRR